MKLDEFHHFSVIGYGRFGSLLVRELTKWGKVDVVETAPLNESLLPPNAQIVPPERALQSPVIFLTIPIRHIQRWINTYGPGIQPGTLLIDCASVKETVIGWILPVALHQKFYYVASHPLFGPDSAARGIAGHRIVIIPQIIPYGLLRQVIRLFESKLGLQVLRMSAVEHDRMMAYNLSLVHLIGRALGNMNIDQLPLKMDNLDGLLRISKIATNDTFELFLDMNRYNPFAPRIQKEFREAVAELVRRIAGEEKKEPIS